MKKIYCCVFGAMMISNVEAQNFNFLWSDSSKKKTLLLKLSNVAGIIVLETPVNNNPVIISNMMPGIYIYTVYTPEGIIARGKLSKQ